MHSTHFAIVESSATLYADRAAFYVPSVDPTSNAVLEWKTVTFAQFKLDIDSYARYWTSVFETRNIEKNSVIGLWIGGFTYLDLLHVYGLSRAGYIPQLFSLRLPNPDIISELLARADAKALIFDASFKDVLGNAAVPVFPFQTSVPPSFAEGPLAPIAARALDDTVFIFHTSGSTSGSPKLVPCNYRWLEASIAKSYQLSVPRRPGQGDVTTWMGSVCHIGQSFMLFGALYHGSCTIQPTVITFDTPELLDMITRCGLNRLRQFAAFLSKNIRAAQKDPQLLSALAGLDEVLYSGMPLPQEEEKWAYAHMPLKNLFGSTECGATLTSVGGCGNDVHLLRALEKTDYAFLPIDGQDANGLGHHSTAQMLEFVVLSTSGDCPHASLRNANDGHFHTGDLFQEVAPGLYLSCGRNDDWIKSENSLRCDTKAIEDNVRETCGKFVLDCIVVGSGRPSPTLFVEASGDMDETKLKKDIIRKTRAFHSRRYLHERITDPKFIVVVPRLTLPRTATKGNIRRKAVEDQFQSQLDTIYGLVR